MSVLWAIYQSDLLGIKTNLPTINVTVQVCLRNANLALKCCHQFITKYLWPVMIIQLWRCKSTRYKKYIFTNVCKMDYPCTVRQTEWKKVLLQNPQIFSKKLWSSGRVFAFLSTIRVRIPLGYPVFSIKCWLKRS